MANQLVDFIKTLKDDNANDPNNGIFVNRNEIVRDGDVEKDNSREANSENETISKENLKYKQNKNDNEHNIRFKSKSTKTQSIRNPQIKNSNKGTDNSYDVSSTDKKDGAESDIMSSVSSNQGQKYQGYPYRNPIIIDVPSIDSVTASKWNNLPRKQLVPAKKRPIKPEIYIDMPGTSGASTAQQGNVDSDSEPDDIPTIYISIPESGSQPNRSNDGEMQDGSNGGDRTDFIEETIFYDPFDNKLINVNQNTNHTPNQANTSKSESLSNAGEGSSLTTSAQEYTSKETFVYGSQRPTLDLSQSVMEGFPEPPPPYTEIPPPTYTSPDNLTSPVSSPSPEPPRTEVIVPNPQLPPTGGARGGRKLLLCQFCRVEVNTFAIRENGTLTHVLACIFIFFFGPITLCIYCTDYFKYVNHYCPNCNHLIGYEVPMLCQKMSYTKIE